MTQMTSLTQAGIGALTLNVSNCIRRLAFQVFTLVRALEFLFRKHHSLIRMVLNVQVLQCHLQLVSEDQISHHL
jgi:hypothetical protein